ncbi:hypothetical protein RDV64_19190 [Acuticoccus sp. MNP-M23]|uniref:DUF7946 domain-containing protein n=1 Tax=Acuticoccus sp. MNP-M23 TaxID=3072793 RepID=UPI0028169AC1|nr:hypothetical protein [Acuticoccus sp. MNP-M23]WMS42169.1 hypothetical protein RDV64_19190 [Acuticoccus sp. MNP-M23]
MSENLYLRLKYTGDDARRHVLPAYYAGESLAGFSRIAEIALYYAAHGVVRYRRPRSEFFSIYVHPPRAGSFESFLEIAGNLGGFTLLSGVPASLVAAATYDVLKYTLLRVTGRDAKPPLDVLAQPLSPHSANIEAVIDAVEPSARRFQNVIGDGANKIYVINAHGSTINFNDETKSYVNHSQNNREVRGKVFSVHSFNVNSGYGRVYDQELRRSIPFQIQETANPKTKSIIARSLNQYANEQESWINLTFTSIDGPRGRPKKILISNANIDSI